MMKSLSFLLLGLTMLPAAETPSIRHAQNTPNFLIIFTDDQCYRSIGYNNEQVNTPNLDRLAGEGMVIENCYVASPICAASRASMMTGLYPQQHGVIALNNEPFDAFRKGNYKASQALAHRLSEAGYHTALYGKSHLGDPKTYGFAEGRESRDPRDFDTFADAAKFIEKASKMEKPFLLWLAPRQPHVPLIPEQKWLDLYDEQTIKLDLNFREYPLKESINNQGKAGEHFYRDSKYTYNWRKLPAGPPRNQEVMKQFIKAYYATISHLDFQVGELVSKLDDLGLGENTLIIYLSDNGYHLGNHGLGNKITMHEESVRVPMWMRWKGTIKPGLISKALVSSLDVYPTLIDLAEAEMPGHVRNKSLKPLILDPDSEHMPAVYSECTGVGGKKGEGHRMARYNDWKLVLTDQDELKFFDLRKDAHELRGINSSGTEEEMLHQATLKNMLRRWMDSIGDR